MQREAHSVLHVTYSRHARLNPADIDSVPSRERVAITTGNKSYTGEYPIDA